MFRFVSVALMLGLAAPAVAQQKPTREQKVRADREKVEAEGFWIYNDLDKGFAEAKKSGKPLLVVLRCIPCEECVKLDDDLVNSNPRVRPLLEKYVCVRVVSTNGLDLSLFQFDYDQSFAAFLLHADGTVYGRFGTRSHRTYWSDDVSVEGLGKALEGGLELHASYPKSKDALAKKRGPAPEFATPEKLPTLKGKYGPTLKYDGNVVQNCIHCHQIGEATKEMARAKRDVMPEEVLFPYPHPKAVGLILDPKERAKVVRVEKDTPAEAAKFQAGDTILTLDGQPLLSIADVQWALHQTPAGGRTIPAEVERDGLKMTLSLPLKYGWRKRDDISWRATSWALRRMGTGGLLLEELPAADRQKAGLGEEEMGLRVKHVGQYGPHAAAKNAGFQQGDVIVSFDTHTHLMRETDLLSYAMRCRKAGEKIPVTVLRGGKKVELTLPMQE